MVERVTIGMVTSRQPLDTVPDSSSGRWAGRIFGALSQGIEVQQREAECMPLVSSTSVQMKPIVCMVEPPTSTCTYYLNQACQRQRTMHVATKRRLRRHLGVLQGPGTRKPGGETEPCCARDGWMDVYVFVPVPRSMGITSNSLHIGLRLYRVIGHWEEGLDDSSLYVGGS